MIEKKEMKDKDKLADFLRNTDYTISKLSPLIKHANFRANLIK